jgi:hypothetical protein
MNVDERESYTIPSLEVLEHNLETAMDRVRREMERKIGGEINFLENMVNKKNQFVGIVLHNIFGLILTDNFCSIQVREQQEEGYVLCDKVTGFFPAFL